MKKDIIIAGVGGQGILSIAAAIGLAAVNSELFLKQAEVHGMSQRGGAVQSHLRISDHEIASDLITEGHCDLILSVEPMEALRYVPFLSPEGWVVTSGKTYRNIDNYPGDDQLFSAIGKWKNHRIIDADSAAKKLGSQRVSNIVMLGAAMDIIGIREAYIEKALRTLFSRKGEEVIQMNLSALKAGQNLGVKS